jgi:hypothetical protein
VGLLFILHLIHILSQAQPTRPRAASHQAFAVLESSGHEVPSPVPSYVPFRFWSLYHARRLCPFLVTGFLRIRSVNQATDDGSRTIDRIHAHAAVPHSSVPAPAACPPAGLPCACAQRAASGLSAVYATMPRHVYAVPAALRSTIEGVISNPNQPLIPICVSNYIRKFDSILIIDNCRINISTSITCRLIELESIYPVVKKGEKGNI